MAVTAYAASGQLALSEFRTTVVGASDSISMSKLVARNATTSTTTTDIQYTGTNVPWLAGTGLVQEGTNASIPERTSGAPTPAISISDFHGAVPWFYTMRANTWKYASYVPNPNYDKDGNLYIQGADKGVGGTTFGTKLTWDNVLVHTRTSSFPTSISTGGFTYYRGGNALTSPGSAAQYTVFRIGRD